MKNNDPCVELITVSKDLHVTRRSKELTTLFYMHTVIISSRTCVFATTVTCKLRLKEMSRLFIRHGLSVNVSCMIRFLRFSTIRTLHVRKPCAKIGDILIFIYTVIKENGMQIVRRKWTSEWTEL